MVERLVAYSIWSRKFRGPRVWFAESVESKFVVAEFWVAAFGVAEHNLARWERRRREQPSSFVLKVILLI